MEYADIVFIVLLLNLSIELSQEVGDPDHFQVGWTPGADSINILKSVWDLNVIQSDSWLSLSLFVKSAPGVIIISLV